MIKKILVANRGEIAIHIMRACREIGIPSVAVHPEADKDALFTKYANDAYLIGLAQATQTYLNICKMIQTSIEKLFISWTNSVAPERRYYYVRR
jgi:pyruvate carboxylase subunit A